MLKTWSRCALVGFGSTRPLQLLSKIGSKLMTGQIVLLDTLPSKVIESLVEEEKRAF